MKKTVNLLHVLALSGAALVMAGCGPHESKLKAPARHDLRGEIVGVVDERRALLVHHEEIPGYMPEMTMEFGIGEADIRFFKDGQRIAASMIEDEESPGGFRLEGIRVLEAVKDAAVESAARRLQENTLIRGKRAFREVGETAPEFALYNQAGEVVRFEQFRGKRVVMPAVLPLVARGHPPLPIACLVTAGTLGGRWFQLMWSHLDVGTTSA